MLQAKLPFFGRAAYLDDELSRVEKLTRRVLVLSMKGGAADTLSNEEDGLVALERLSKTYTLRHANSKTAISRARRNFHLKYDDFQDGMPGLLAEYYAKVRERTDLGDAPDDVACIDLLSEALTGESNRTCYRSMGPILMQWQLKDTGLEEILEQLMRIAPSLDKPTQAVATDAAVATRPPHGDGWRGDVGRGFRVASQRHLGVHARPAGPAGL